LNHISLSFGKRVIFDDVNWTITPRSRIGLVGDNGAGKTTLLRAIAGVQELDSGSIEMIDRRNTTLGCLPQDLVELESLNILNFLKKRSGLSDLEATLKTCEENLFGTLKSVLAANCVSRIVLPTPLNTDRGQSKQEIRDAL